MENVDEDTTEPDNGKPGNFAKKNAQKTAVNLSKA